MKFSYDSTFWPAGELSTWEIAAWSFYGSEGWATSYISAKVYWDYYTDDDAVFTTTGDTSSTTETGTSGNGEQEPVPGFQFVEVLILVIFIPSLSVIKRRRK